METQVHRAKVREGPSVAIVVLNWNGWTDTIECLESLLKVKDINFEIILIDNGSTDNSGKIIENWIDSHNIPKIRFTQPHAKKSAIDESKGIQIGMQRVVLYLLPENIGFCAGNNVGLKYALANGVPYALILNNDTLVDSKVLSSLVAYAQKHPDAGLIGGQIRYANDPKVIWWMGGSVSNWLRFEHSYHNQPVDKSIRDTFSTDWVTGCMMLIPLEVFSKIGGYDEKLFIWGEDLDLSVRVAKAGYKLTVVPSAIIYHKVSKTLGILSLLTYYYSGRNHLYIKRRYLPYLMWLAFFSAYFPYKFIQSIFFTMKYHNTYYDIYYDIFFDFIFNHYGKWRRHDSLAAAKYKIDKIV
jgi:hypothetical protein